MTTDPLRAAQPYKRPLKIAIAANFLATPLRASLTLWLQRLNIQSIPDFAPYDSVIQELLNQNSACSKADLSVILVRAENWCRQSETILSAMAEQNFDIFLRSVESSARRQPGTIFLIIACPPSPALRLCDALATAEERLTAALKVLPNVDFVGTNDLNRYYPVAEYNAYFIRGTGDERGDTHYSELCYATLGTIIARRISALFTEPRKVIAVDCDNTLWSGICGEQGPLGVVVEHGHRLLQRTLLEQWERGRLLFVCSKNNEADVLAVFDRHPEMLIRRKHLSAIRANWRPKVDNLRSLAKEFDLGLDAFIFLDDDPFECESVATVCPEVRIVKVACTDHAVVARTLLQVWEFDRTSVTSEDRQRVSYYRQESERNSARDASISLEEFMKNLNLKIVISPLRPDDINRAVQLTQRVNQFNLNGIRRSAADIQVWLSAATCLIVSASDRFGDYGLIGLVIYTQSENALQVETLALSCRALGRGVEQRLAAHLAEAARKSGRSYIEFEFLPTPKNAPIQGFLAEIGARDCASGRHVVPVEDLTRIYALEA